MFGYRECSCFSAVRFEFDPVASSMQDQCRGSESSEANSGGTVIEQRCVTDDSSSVSYPARMRIYACDEQYNFQQFPPIFCYVFCGRLLADTSYLGQLHLKTSRQEPSYWRYVQRQ